MHFSTFDNTLHEITTEFICHIEGRIRKHNLLLAQVAETQEVCFENLRHQRYRIEQITEALKKLVPKSTEEKMRIQKLQDKIIQRETHLEEIEKFLPKKSTLYLKIILGDVNVSILNPKDKIQYKNNYENFKLIMSAFGLILAAINLIFKYRLLQLIYMYLSVWYYCTLTIRESILKLNGSRIKNWWRAHHFISTIAACVLLVWPEGEHWQLFRNQFTYFNFYINFVQCLQFAYQQLLLYNLKGLGELNNMEITIEGFQSWMWRGLSFLLPFLIASYAFEAYNSYKLFYLTFTKNCPWHVPVMSCIFLILFVGNTIAILMVLYEKFTNRTTERYRLQSKRSTMKMPTRKMLSTNNKDNE